MKELNKQGLIEYIRHAVDMESLMVAQDRIEKGYRAISSRKVPIAIPKPLPQRRVVQEQGMDSALPVFWLFGIGLMGFSGLLFLISLFDAGSVTSALALIIIIFLIGLILFLWAKKRDREIVEEQERYNSDYIIEANKVVEENKRRKEALDRDLAEWTKTTDSIINELKRRKEEIQGKLEEYYSVNVIFPKYRNLPALTSICEYLESGRCDELTGPNGAYNLYESEMRQNIIIYQLDQIISNLESIRQNQYYLYEEVSKIKSNSDRIVNELSSIHGYVASLTDIAALNTYYNGVTASCSTAMTFYRSIL